MSSAQVTALERLAEFKAALQTFERGTLVWRGDIHQIYVLYSDHTWAVFEDTFKEGQAESDPSLLAPRGRLQPILGFGKVWREHPEVREKLRAWRESRARDVLAQTLPQQAPLP